MSPQTPSESIKYPKKTAGVNQTEKYVPEIFAVENVSWRPASANLPDKYRSVSAKTSFFGTVLLENGGKIYNPGNIYSK
ncbi:hypothetical protein RG963_16285 [Methanosarcina sp. Z-7115]|uniref:Uncharacterized protein n=1 Tax=Methanosarcina baikalica TaxID=3073890 RepID=A0ABU2D5Z8_9EURY|nr:hypothetical protein [Methanosarcina sp. Z-7115]MDR7667302.1 hypothetical protein [Methanosarcina sp. Z-7115]